MKIVFLAICLLSLLAEFYFLLLKDANDISKRMRNTLKVACFVNGIFSLYFACAAIKVSVNIGRGTIYGWILPGIYLFLICSFLLVNFLVAFKKKNHGKIDR